MLIYIFMVIKKKKYLLIHDIVNKNKFIWDLIYIEAKLFYYNSVIKLVKQIGIFYGIILMYINSVHKY